VKALINDLVLSLKKKYQCALDMCKHIFQHHLFTTKNTPNPWRSWTRASIM